MALCRVTGTVYLPNGSLAVNRQIVFRREKKDITAEYLGALFPDDVWQFTNAQGQIDVTLLTGRYVAFAQAPQRAYFGIVTVPDAPTAEFADIIGDFEIPDTPPVWYNQALQARDEAVAAADEADALVSPYDSVADATAAVKPESVDRVLAKTSWGTVAFLRKSGGPCLGGGWIPDGIITPFHFGAIGDGITDDTIAIRNALHFAGSPDLAGQQKVVSGANGTWGITDTIYISRAGTHYLSVEHFKFVAIPGGFASDTSAAVINHATGKITLSGNSMYALMISGGKTQVSHIALREIEIDCAFRCNGLGASNASNIQVNGITVTRQKSVGIRTWPSGGLTDSNFSRVKVFERSWEDLQNEATFSRKAIGIMCEAVDCFWQQVTPAYNRVQMYIEGTGSIVLNQVHPYNKVLSEAIAVASAVDSGVSNSAASGNKIRFTTSAPHGLIAGDLVYVPWLTGISGSYGGVTDKWSRITIIDQTTVDLDDTLFAGSYTGSYAINLMTENRENIGLWVGPGATDVRVSQLQLDGVNLRLYSSSVTLTDVTGSCSTGAGQTAGYPWLDYRALTAADSLPGLCAVNIRLMEGLSKECFTPQGSGSLSSALNAKIDNVVSRGGSRIGTASYVPILFSVPKTGLSLTGFSAGVTYSGVITVDGIAYPISVIGADAATIADLSDQIAAQTFGLANVQFNFKPSNELRLRLADTGSATLLISGNVFTSLDGFSSFGTPVLGNGEKPTYSMYPGANRYTAAPGDQWSNAFGIAWPIPVSSGGMVNKTAGFYGDSIGSMAYQSLGKKRFRWTETGQYIWGDAVGPITMGGISPSHMIAHNDWLNFSMIYYGTSAIYPSLDMSRSRSTAIGGNVAVLSGDQLGALRGGGSNGVGLFPGAAILFSADGNWTSSGSSQRPGRLHLQTSNNTGPVSRWSIGPAGHLTPAASDAYSLGSASETISNIYLQNAPIISSDERIKCDIRNLDDRERAVALRLKGLIRTYRLRSAVEVKGSAARIHIGAIAQDVVAAFEEEGLDPWAYGICCRDTWDARPAMVGDDGEVAYPAIGAGEQFSVNYTEMLAFIIAAI